MAATFFSQFAAFCHESTRVSTTCNIKLHGSVSTVNGGQYFEELLQAAAAQVPRFVEDSKIRAF